MNRNLNLNNTIQFQNCNEICKAFGKFAQVKCAESLNFRIAGNRKLEMVCCKLNSNANGQMYFLFSLIGKKWRMQISLNCMNLMIATYLRKVLAKSGGNWRDWLMHVCSLKYAMCV